jgi:hypothetical protein
VLFWVLILKVKNNAMNVVKCRTNVLKRYKELSSKKLGNRLNKSFPRKKI